MSKKTRGADGHLYNVSPKGAERCADGAPVSGGTKKDSRVQQQLVDDVAAAATRISAPSQKQSVSDVKSSATRISTGVASADDGTSATRIKP